MKIMHILNTGTYSGAENVAISIIGHSKNYDCVYTSLYGPIGDILKKNGIKYVPVNKLSIIEIKKVIKTERPDIIHAHDFTASIIAALSTYKIPIISHLHNNPLWIKSINAKSILYLVSNYRYKKILTVSDAVVSEFVFSKYIKKKTLVIGNPIISNKIIEKSQVAKEKKGFDVIFLGRFSEQKNPFFFLEIVSELKKQIVNLSVGMVGTGELFDTVKKQIKELGLSDNVSCPGFIENPYGVLANSKILCVPSKWEGFGLVAVEALSLGVPVVSSNVGGLKGIVTNKVGKICDTKEEYVEEIKRLLCEDCYYKLKKFSAIERSKFLDNEDRYFEKLNQIYIDSIN